MQPNNKYKIICIDDEPEFLEMLESTVDSFGYEVETAIDPDQCLEKIEKSGPRCVLVISDFQMPTLNGFEFRKKVSEVSPEVPFAILSGHVTREMALQGIDAGICGFVGKPFVPDDLKNFIQEKTKDRISAIEEETEIKTGFVQEYEELSEELEAIVLDLESDPGNLSSLDRLYGILHTIKGISGFFKPDLIHRFTHRFEDLVSNVRSGQVDLNKNTISAFLKGLDTLNELVSGLFSEDILPDIESLLARIEVVESDSVDSSPVADRKDASSKGEDSTVRRKKADIRVSTDLLNEFMALSGEMTVLRNMINKSVRSIEKELTGSSEVSLLWDLLDEMHKINGSIQGKIVDLRKVEMNSVYQPLKRTVRDLGHKLEKEVEVVFDGGDVRVDTTLAQVLSNTLIHLVRNCMDHGVESTAEREESGKSKSAKIEILSSENGEEINVRVVDDGRGIDVQKIRQKVIDKGLATLDEIESMPDQQILMSIFEAGFSTAEEVTDVSGRGVGMDMVKKSVEDVGGKLSIDTSLGKGTSIEMILPIPKSVTIVNSLFVTVNSSVFAIPEDDIYRLLKYSDAKDSKIIRSIDKTQTLEFEGGIIPLIKLSDVLNLSSNSENNIESSSIIVVASGSKKIALVVDETLDIEDSVVKKLDSNLKMIQVIRGVTYLGDGRLSIVLDVDGIMNLVGVESIEGEVEKDCSSVESVLDQNLDEYLIFSLGVKGFFAIDMANVFRIETFSKEEIKKSGESEVVIYRDQVIKLIDFRKELSLSSREDDSKDKSTYLMFHIEGKFFGGRIDSIVDLVRSKIEINQDTSDRKGVLGSGVISGMSVSLIDLNSIVLDIINGSFSSSIESTIEKEERLAS